MRRGPSRVRLPPARSASRFTCAGAQSRARADRYVPVHRDRRARAGAADRRRPAQARRARRQAHRRPRHGRARRHRHHRLAAGQARRPLEADRPRPDRCCAAATRCASACRRTGSTQGARPRGRRPRRRAPASRVIGRLNVYRAAYASWYGPGLYGNPLGCGGTLTAGRLGVAHKSLPCGTKVTLQHGKRTRARAGHRPRPVRRAAASTTSPRRPPRASASGPRRDPHHALSRDQRGRASCGLGGRRVGLALLVVERRHAHAEQPDRARRRVGAQQLERDARRSSPCR